MPPVPSRVSRRRAGVTAVEAVALPGAAIEPADHVGHDVDGAGEAVEPDLATLPHRDQHEVRHHLPPGN
jgi:hypothetical protein